MPVISDFKSIIKDAAQSDKRTLILSDKIAQENVYTQFDYPYDAREFVSAVANLFDESFIHIKQGGEAITNGIPLAIVTALGRYKLTIVTRHESGHVSIENGETKPIEDYISSGE